MKRITAASQEQMISLARESARGLLKKLHYFTASLFIGENSCDLSLMISDDIIDLPLKALPAGMSAKSAMRQIADAIHQEDMRTTVIEQDDAFIKIAYSDEVLMQIYREHYLTIPTEKLMTICRDKIFATVAKHYCRPFKIEVTKDSIYCMWGEYNHHFGDYVYRFGWGEKPKAFESLVIICTIINEYSGNKYEFSTPIDDNWCKAGMLMIRDHSDMYQN